MTRKHFQAVAKTIKNCRVVAENTGTEFMLDAIARDLATTFRDINPRFDRVRFLAACGLDA